MTEYYFIASLLPPLEIGHVPTLAYAELKELLKINLSKEDLEEVEKFLRWIDIENLRSFWSGESLDPRGNFAYEEIEQALIDGMWPDGQEFPLYLQDYLAKYHSTEERLNHFPQLLSQFFSHKIEEESGFLKDFFKFQKELALVMVGFRAKQTHKDVAYELQFEDPTDPIIAQILAQKDAKSYEPPFEYKELKQVFEEYSDQPMELFKAIYEYQFKTIVEIWGGEIFTLDRILNYMSRLLLVERWLELDVQKGIDVVDTIERAIQ